MKKLVFVLLLLVPMVAVADRRSDFVNKILEYENTQTNNNIARINTYGVNQEKLDLYRVAHPRYNFPKNIKDLNEKQAKQILSYFWDNYRFSDYKYDEIQEKVWDMMIHMSMSDLEKQINVIKKQLNYLILKSYLNRLKTDLTRSFFVVFIKIT